MVDPRRRRATADVDVVVGRAPEPAPPSASDLDLYDVFRNVQATRQANTPRPADPVADDSTLSAIRRGIVAHAEAQNTPAANTRRARAEDARLSERARRDAPRANRALALNAADAVSLGFADEIAGVGNVGRQLLSGADVDVGSAYRAGRNEFRTDLENLSAEFPGSRRAGQFVGNIAGMALPVPGPLGRLGQGGTALRRIGGAAALGAAYGGLSGLGHSEVDLTDADLDAPVGSTEGLSPEQIEALPTQGGQLMRDIATPAGAGALMGGGLASAVEAGAGIRALYGAARDRARLNEALGRRAQDIIESGRIPSLAGAPADDIALANAATDEAAEVATSQPVRTSLRGEVTDILRENPDMNRLRTAGIIGKPAMRRVAQMPGGIEGMADDLDRLGISQRGEVLRTSEGARRAEQIGQIARRQRNSILESADVAGVEVNGQDIADRIRARADELRRLPSRRAAQQAAALERTAQQFEGRIMQDGTRVPEGLPVIAPTFRQRGDGSLDEIAQHYGDLGRYSNTSELPSVEVANARDIRRAIVDARESALRAWDPDAAQSFADAQRAAQIGLTVSPAGRLSELEARGANQSLSLTDKIGGGTGAAIGSGIGTAVGGPAGGLVGAGMGGLIGTAGNRIWRDFEPSVMASLAERPMLQSRLAELGIESTSRELPAGLRYMVEGMRLRSPRAFGNMAATPDVQPREQYEPAAAATDAELENIDPMAGLPLPGEEGADPEMENIDPYAGLPMPEDE